MELGIDRRPGRFKSGIVVYYYRPIAGPGAVNLTAGDFGGCTVVTAEQVCIKLACMTSSLWRSEQTLQQQQQQPQQQPQHQQQHQQQPQQHMQQYTVYRESRNRLSASKLYNLEAGNVPPSITPAGIHLFALYHIDGQVWVPPNEFITLGAESGTGLPSTVVPAGGGGSSCNSGGGGGAAMPASSSATPLGPDCELVFRIRYRLPPPSAAGTPTGTGCVGGGAAAASAPPLIDSLGALRTLDEGAFCYLFAQCRQDFISNRMHDIYGADMKAEACLGFAALDLARIAFEEKTADLAKVQSRYNWADMIPQCVSKQFNFAMRLKIGLKSKLPRSVEEHYREYVGTREPLPHSMRSYLKELLEKYVPRYCVETFVAASHYKIVVDPYDLKRPGIAVFGEDEDLIRSHNISDLLGVNVSECNLLLNFKNSAPLSLNMTSSAEARSLAALLDGYYRLMVNYHFSLSDQVFSPMVKHWATFKCFGPVRRDWAFQKFKRLNNNKEGTFLVKQRSTSFSEYVIFVQKMGRLVAVTVRFDGDKGRYSCSEDLKSLFQVLHADPDFPNVKELLRYYRNGNNQILRIANQIAPVSNDITSLMICHVRSPQDRGDNEPSSLCTLSKPVLFSTNDLLVKELLGSGTFTEVYDAYYNQEQVVIKKLHPDKEKSMLQVFQKDTQKSMFWKHAYVLNVLGVCLAPFGVVMEKSELGPLDEFLRRSRSSGLQMYHYILAAEQLGQAVMYLDECGTPHGDIRCKNVVVKCFDKCDEILVKLAPCLSSAYANRLPLSHECNLSRLPWIAPERYTSLDNETIAADVFSFAMSLWEIFSKGARPLSTLLTFEEVKQFHEGHRRLPQPSALVQHARLAPANDAQAAVLDRLNRLMQQNIDIEPLNRMQPPEIVKELRQIRQKFDRRPYDQMNDVNSATHLDGKAADTCLGLSEFSFLEPDVDATCLPASHLQARRPLPDVPLERHVIRSQDIIVNKDILLGQGHYGEVYKAVLQRSDGTRLETAVKRLKSGLSSSVEENDRKAFAEFQQELKIMSELKHDNIVQVFGKCHYHNGDDALNDSFLIVMEFVPNGCLRDYLKKNAGAVSASRKLKFAVSIAKGMQFLHSKDIIHRDLAARNVLVTAEPDVKISDFGLARCLEEKDYYRCSDHTALPALWCAPESLELKKFFKSSDIWSYAVVLWELYTNGDKPELPCDKRLLPGGNLLAIDPGSLLHALRTGKRLPKPCECDDRVYTVMQSCWSGDASQRPDFAKVVLLMESIAQ